MSLVAAYSDSESESEDETEKRNEGEPLSGIIVELEVKKKDTGTLVSKDSVKNEFDTFEVEEKSFQIDDEDDWQSNVLGKQNIELDNSDTRLFHQLPQPKSGKYEDVTEELDDEFLKKKAIPATESNVNKKKSEAVHSTKDEHFTVSPRQALLTLPKPQKKKGPVRISIPTLQEIGADSDSDCDDESKKKPRPANKKSSLFAILPKPKHSVTVGPNKNRVFEKKENRPLIPHSLAKKPEGGNSSSSKKHGQMKKNIQLKEDNDSESEDEEFNSENFFSLATNQAVDNSKKELIAKNLDKLNTTETVLTKIDTFNNKETTSLEKSDISTKTTTNSTKIKAERTAVTKNNTYFSSLLSKSNSVSKNAINSDNNDSNKTANSQRTVKSNISNSGDFSDVTAPYGTYSGIRKHDIKRKETLTPSFGAGSINEVTAPYVTGGNDVIAPYGFSTNSAVTAPYGVSNYTGPYSGGNNDVTAPYGSDVTGSYSNSSQQSERLHSENLNERFFAYAYEKSTTVDEQQEQSTDYYNQPNEDLPIDQAALTALQGRKRRNEDITIIDINAEQLQQNSEEYLKNLTKESTYQTKKPKKDQPTHVEKRKHQITYLAFQAKERELELQQAWAENRSTKRQTQSRYGF